MHVQPFTSTLLATLLASSASFAADWTLSVTRADKAQSSGEDRNPATGKVSISKGQVLSISCTSPALCSKITATQSHAAMAPKALDALDGRKETSVQFALRPDLAEQGTAELRVLYEDKVLFTTPIEDAGGSEEAPPSTPPGETTLTSLLSTPCPQKRFDITPYDASANRAEVVITARGGIIFAHPGDFDENDTLKVTVYGDSRLLPLLKVQRKSAFRVVGGINILGADVRIPAQLLTQAAEEAVPNCSEASFELSDFAPGRGEVELSIMSGMDAIVVGSFEFSVHPLYTGMFTLGGIWTTLLDPSFEVATRGGGSVIVQTESGDRRFAYAFLYTPFLWGKRDIEKGPNHWLHRVNPSFGFVLNDPLDNLLVGASVDIASTLLVTGGYIFSHVDKLDGVAVGDPFEGTTGDLPITRVWRYKPYVGASIDLRAAVALIQKVVSP